MNLKTRKKLRKLKNLKKYCKGSLKISVVSTKYLMFGFTVKHHRVSKRVSNTSRPKLFFISKGTKIPRTLSNWKVQKKLNTI